MQFQDSEIKQNKLHRVVLIGDSGVGKTSILSKLAKDQFNKDQLPTVGSTFFLYRVEIQNSSFEMQIWDTAGQERFKALGPIYYQNASAAVVVFDLTFDFSFESVMGWIERYQDVVGQNSLIVLVGNKCDLKNSIQVSDEMVKDISTKVNGKFFKTSASTGENIKATFEYIALMLFKKGVDANLQQESVDISLLQHQPKCFC